MSCRTGMWRGVVVTFAICSGLSVLLQPLVLQGWNTEKACVDWILVRVCSCASVCACGHGEECGSRVPCTIQAQAMYSLYAEIAHPDCHSSVWPPMCSDEL